MHALKLSAFFVGLGVLVVSDPAHSPAQFRSRGGDGGGGSGPGGPGGFGKGNFTPVGGGQPGGPMTPPAPGGGFGPPGGGFGPPGGGFGPPGGGYRPDPEKSWGMLQRTPGSTPDAIDLGKIDPRARDWMRKRAEQDGSIPLPESGMMTKAQYLDHFARSEAAKAAKAAAGGAPGAPGATVVMMSTGPGGPTPGGPAPFPPPGGPPGGGEDRGAQRLREQDKDGDGRVSRAEADSRLRDNFDRIDTDRDGYITLDEYRGYYATQSRDRDRDRGSGGDPNGGGGSGGYWGPGGDRRDEKKDVEESKPVALRYGHLPKDLPKWYDEYDADKDGQVALYEWRKAGKDMAEFREMDLNGDGLITADEFLRFGRLKVESEKIAALNDPDGARPSVAAGRGPGGRPGPGSGPTQPASADKGNGDKGSADKNAGSSDKGGDRGDKGDKRYSNPFQPGSNKGK